MLNHYNSYLSLLIPIFLVLVVSSCENLDEENYDYEVLAEGCLSYFVDTLLWVGGECDPNGFILEDYTWVYGSDEIYNRLYITGNVDSTNLEMNVRVGGKIDTVFAGGMVSPLRTYFKIIADTVYAVNTDQQDTTFFEFQSLSIGDHGCFQIPDAGTQVIRTDSVWTTVWDNYWDCYDGLGNKTPVPEINFQNNMVLGVYWGDNCRYSGCSNMSESIQDIYLLNDTIYVFVGELQSLGLCAACVEPLHLVKTTKRDYPVKFLWNNSSRMSI
ncbi:MAG: hypothetical protein H8E14_13910 [Candidatus Marinimicrobia bacterium]|nr:hypothetical protein [Candidatus Neomarinimicrobiota bacterium]